MLIEITGIELVLINLHDTRCAERGEVPGQDHLGAEGLADSETDRLRVGLCVISRGALRDVLGGDANLLLGGLLLQTRRSTGVCQFRVQTHSYKEDGGVKDLPCLPPFAACAGTLR